MRFHDLKIGDKFEVAGEIMIKIKNTHYSCKPLSYARIPLSEREPNAVNLRNGHAIVMGEKVNVTLIKRDESKFYGGTHLIKTDVENIIQNRIIEDKSIYEIYPPLRPNEQILTIKIPTQCKKCGKFGYYYGETILGTQSTKSDAIIKHIVSDDECMYLCHNCHFDEHKKEVSI